LDNKLTTMRDVTLRDLTGKKWRAKFYMHKTHGRLSRKGWTEFSSEYGLKVGDRCIFKLIEKDTLLVRVVKQ
jgi:B3 DNA binding domain